MNVISEGLARFRLDYSLKIPAKPHGREVTPPELPDYVISAVKQVSDLHWVITSYRTDH